MENVSNKVFKVVGVYCISVFITLLIFYMMSWYSFGTFPTEIVLYRIIFSSLILTIIITVALVVVKKCKLH